MSKCATLLGVTLLFISAVAASVTVPPTTVMPTVAPSQTCSSLGGENFTCAPGTGCCGAGSMEPQCINMTSSQCCTWYIAATSCALDESCCGANGVGASSAAFCCAAHTTCCQTNLDGESSCCATETEQCCSGSNAFCCGRDEQCCGYQCCGEDQVCCGGNTCCDKANQYCSANNQCEYITQPPSYHPGPYANWSTVWSTNLQAQCTRTDFGVLCNNVPLWLGLVDPKNGETLWNITEAAFNITGPQLYDPISLTKEIIYLAGYGINIKTGKVLWQEQVTASCSSVLSVFADGPSNLVLSCIRQPSATIFLDIYSIFVNNGTVRFHVSKNVTNVNYGVLAVSRHIIVMQYNFALIGLNSFTGTQKWNYTSNNAYFPYPLSVQAADAFVFTQSSNATALRYEDGTVLWSHSNYVSTDTSCQTVARTMDPKTKGQSMEVIAWIGVNGTLIFTDSRTGVTELQVLTVSPSYCVLAANNAYVWASSGSNFTAISLTTRRVEWTAHLPSQYGPVIHVASPTNAGPYVRDYNDNLVRLYDGARQHRFELLRQNAPLHVSQFEDAGVVVMNVYSGLLAFELPR